MRSPLLLYRVGLGWVMGERFLRLTHRGRKSARVRDTVLEVAGRDRESGTYYVASGWGEGSHWFRNIEKTPGVGVQVGGRKFKARAQRLSLEEASDIHYKYALKYPRAFAILSNKILGEKLEPSQENAFKMAKYVPVVALRPQ
jgi:deazaflavin-dependent oxidoreductase (nitroreductase family)